MSHKLKELNNWRKTFPGMTAQEVSLMLARSQFINKANSRLLAQIYEDKFMKIKYQELSEKCPDLLPVAEDCYKALRELPPLCFSAWTGQKIELVNRVRNYIDALEKELLKTKLNDMNKKEITEVRTTSV